MWPHFCPLDGPHGGAAESRGEQAIVAGGHAAALEVAEHQRARLLAGELLKLVRHPARDAADAPVLTRHRRARWSIPFRPSARAPSATTTIENRRPDRSRALILSHTFASSYGISGIRMTSAVPASPACSAMKPAWRPITSITMTRSWLSAVVCSLSIASSAVFTAVSKPNVVTVPATSLSIVLGTPTIFMPLSEQSVGDRQRAVAADGDDGVDAHLPRVRRSARRSDRSPRTCRPACCARPLERIAAVGGAQDRAAQVRDAAHGFARERDDVVVAEKAGDSRA